MNKLFCGRQFKVFGFSSSLSINVSLNIFGMCCNCCTETSRLQMSPLRRGEYYRHFPQNSTITGQNKQYIYTNPTFIHHPNNSSVWNA